MWFLLGVFHCNSFQHKMKKRPNGQCSCSSLHEENIPHILLSCEYYSEIREKFMVELTFCNINLMKYSNDVNILLTSFLDPQSPKLPDEIKHGWTSLDKVYNISRNYCYNIYKKREKIQESLEKNQN